MAGALDRKLWQVAALVPLLKQEWVKSRSGALRGKVVGEMIPYHAESEAVARAMAVSEASSRTSAA